MRFRLVALIVLNLALTSCSPNGIDPPEDFGPVYLTVDKISYAFEDTIRVTLHNQSSDPIFLQGCSHLHLATKTDTGWAEAPMLICVWEGFALKINPKALYRERHEAKYYPGVHKFVAPVYVGCLEGKPISQAQCLRQTQIYSAVFTVQTR